MSELPEPTRAGTRIVSAAVRINDGRVIMCVRHLDHIFLKALGIDTTKVTDAGIELVRGHVDGFVTNTAEFLSREDAWPIALGAGQIIPAEMGWQTGRLHSEHLY